MDLQVAISQAIEFARQALPNEKLTVEEVEHVDSPPAWTITLGYKRALPQKKAIGVVAGFSERYDPTPRYAEYEDVYKAVVVPEDGSTPSMKIRKV